MTIPLGAGGEAKDDPMQLQRPQIKFDLNLGTILAIILAGIGGLYKFASLENRVEMMDNRGLSRIAISDSNFANINQQLKLAADIPFRVTTLESNQKALNDRMDRLADIMLAGQDTNRKDLTLAVDSIKKEVASVGTKVEVLSSRLEDMQNVQRPQTR